MKFKIKNKSINYIDIINFQNKYNLKFPEEYIEFLLLYNGGVPLHNKFYSNKENFLVHEFYSIKYGSLLLSDALEDLKIVETILPNYLIPFAIDEGGNQFCFSTEYHDFAKIFVFYLDTDINNEVYITDSFNSFISNLSK